MVDRAQSYLHLLQVGYQFREIDYLSDGIGEYQIIARVNPSRVLIYLYSSAAATVDIGIKMPSGLFIPINVTATPFIYLSTVSLHYATPSLEIGCINTSIGSVAKGFELVKQ